MQGDITGQVGFDAVVNAANAELAPGGSGRRAAGPAVAAALAGPGEAFGVEVARVRRAA